MKNGRIFFAFLLLALLSALLVTAAGAENVALDESNFPDDVFRGYAETFDTDHDGFLSDAERNAVTDINCDGMELESVSGIEFFEKLETLSLKNCASLKYLPGGVEYMEALVSITLDGCTALEQINLDPSGKALMNLSARDCTALTYCRLWWNYNKPVLDLSGCTALETIDGYTTYFGAIKVDQCTGLKTVRAGGSGKLDLSTCPEIRYIELDKASSELNLKNCSKLEELSAAFGVLIGGLDLSDCVSLKKLSVGYCEQLYSLDVTNCPELEILSCGNNHDITSLDVTHNTKLKELYCQTTGISSLDVSHCPELTALECGDQMTALDVSHNTKLRLLNCAGNKLTSLDVSMLPDLTVLYCGGNQLTTLDVTQNPKLKQLYCGNNGLTELDVTHNPELEDLFCHDNNLTTLDVRKTPYLNQHVLRGDVIIETGYPDYGKHVQYLYKGAKYENGVKVDKDVHINTARCTVFWYDWDGSLLEGDPYFPVGIVPVYPNPNPTREADAQYTYTFDGWTPEPAPAKEGENKYTAVYKGKLNSYKITFVNWDGTELDYDWFDYGETPVYSGGTPTREPDAKYTYAFSGWTPALAPVTGEAAYTADFTATLNRYTVTFLDEDGGVLKTADYPYGTAAADVERPADPAKPADVQYTYTFSSWTPEIADVTEDAVYTAQYNATVNKYTIRFFHEDGTLLQSGEVEYGTVPVYAGSEPVKPGTAEFTYTFAGWTPEVVPVDGDADYTAVFSVERNRYTITWIIGKRIETEQVPYGEMPSHEPPAAETVYGIWQVFRKWTPVIQVVTGNASYTAVFDQVTIPAPALLPDSAVPASPVPTGTPALPPDTAGMPVAAEPPAIAESPAGTFFPFADVNSSSPYYGDIVFVWEGGIMNGMSGTSFGENLPLTRGMIVTVLWRMEGSPAAEYTGVFTDVPAGEWFTDGVEWAAANGIVNGYGGGLFGPGDSVTREQLAAILYRYAGTRLEEMSAETHTADDLDRVSGYARNAVNWAVPNGILTVDAARNVRPADPATRGEIARAIHAFLIAAGK